MANVEDVRADGDEHRTVNGLWTMSLWSLNSAVKGEVVKVLRWLYCEAPREGRPPVDDTRTDADGHCNVNGIVTE